MKLAEPFFDAIAAVVALVVVAFGDLSCRPSFLYSLCRHSLISASLGIPMDQSVTSDTEPITEEGAGQQDDNGVCATQ